jgi:hypothetical protein
MWGKKHSLFSPKRSDVSNRFTTRTDTAKSQIYTIESSPIVVVQLSLVANAEWAQLKNLLTKSSICIIKHVLHFLDVLTVLFARYLDISLPND